MSGWEWLVVRVLPVLAASLTRALGRSLSLVVSGDEHVAPLWSGSGAIIYAIWHGQILMLPALNERLRVTRGARPVHVMASRSRDGEMLARFVRRFGLGAVRGSSSRGGAAALRRLARRVRSGHDVAVTPDGPRGPGEHAHSGAVMLAELTGAPLVPMAFAAAPAWRLRSWDRFEIPRPFGRAALVFGAPVPVPGRDRERARKDLEAALAHLTELARAAVARG